MHRISVAVPPRRIAFPSGIFRRTTGLLESGSAADRSFSSSATRLSGWLFCGVSFLFWSVCGCGGYIVNSPSGNGQLTVNESTLSFGAVRLNTKSTKALTLTSSGTAAVTISSVGISGTGFAISGETFPATLDTGQSITLQVSFNPAAAGTANGAITISSTRGAITITLNGTGTAASAPQLTASASSLAFGDVTLNTASTKTLTLSSTGTAAVTISSVALSASEFAISGSTFPVTLNPGQSVTLQVSFYPTVTGAANGAITISCDSLAGGSATVSLGGTGINSTNPVLTLSVTTLNFGDEPVGTPVTLQLTLTSTGDSPVTVSSASVTGAGFGFSGATFPVTLKPTVAVSIQVQFDPISVGPASGALTIASNSSTGSTIAVKLTGVGPAVQHRVTLTWNAPGNSPVPVTGYNLYRATGTGSSFQILNTSSISEMSYVDLTVATNTTYIYYVTSLDAAGIESVPSNEVKVTVP